MQIKEILVLHHSHLDIGYTHSQPILWEMQREYLDLALRFLDQTADWPEHSLPRWTCEMTSPVVRWLRTATPEQTDRFAAYLREGRIGISAMEYNTTPLCTAEQLARQLYPARALRERFGATINTLNQHDINGIPWSMVDLMIDDGIELFIMAINNHFGGTAVERPSVFRWEGPSGRSILVMNGAHYTMFDQLLYSWEDSVPRMQEGLVEYLEVLEQKQYPHDFIYLTATNPPAMWDNSPPNMQVARLIRAWNEQGTNPPIRFVTPAMLLERIQQIPADELPMHRGDWTDYWNFGAASTAYETRLNRRAKPVLFGAELLRSIRPVAPTVASNTAALQDVTERAWEYLNLYDEHTWGSWDTLQHDHPHTRAESHLKLHNAYQARELSDYLLVHELEALAGNAPQTADPVGGVLLVNPTATTRSHYVPIPDAWREPGKRVRANMFQYHSRYDRLDAAPRYGPVEMPPFSWRVMPIDALGSSQPTETVSYGPTEDGRGRYIESPFHRLEFDGGSGRITRLYDKQQAWEVLAPGSSYTFFEYIHERTDALYDNRREAIYDREMLKEKFDISCWHTDWHAVRTHATEPLGYNFEEVPGGVTLVSRFAAPSVENLEQRITLRSDSDVIALEARFTKLDIRTPEALYFVFPLNLPGGWRCHFDTAGVPTELDHEQIARSSRDWVTVDSFVTMHAPDLGATLYCPDAPLVQAGDFNFGRKHDEIPRDAAPLLLAWPLNNYWNTNFPVTQPGRFELNYAFQTHGAFDPVAATASGEAAASEVLTHPVWQVDGPSEGQLISIEGLGVRLLHLKPAVDGRGLIARLVNVSDDPVDARISVPTCSVSAAHWTSPTEVDGVALEVVDGTARMRLESRRVTTVRLE
jgi:alpha-mannosidase